MADRPRSESGETGQGQEGGEGGSNETLLAFGVNAGLVAEIRQRYEIDPESVHPSWAGLFAEREAAPATPQELPPAAPEPPPQAAFTESYSPAA